MGGGTELHGRAPTAADRIESVIRALIAAVLLAAVLWTLLDYGAPRPF